MEPRTVLARIRMKAQRTAKEPRISQVRIQSTNRICMEPQTFCFEIHMEALRISVEPLRALVRIHMKALRISMELRIAEVRIHMTTH